MRPARFHALRDRVMAQVDRTFAEPVRLSFMRNGTPDPDRPMVEIEAPLRVGGGKETGVAGTMLHTWRTRIVAQRAELHMDRTKYPDVKLIKGDKVKALARPGEPWFEVLAVDDRGAARLVVQLGEA
jgi:hypothetical protein